MDTNFIVTEAELVELTGYKLPKKQRQVLDGMGIKYIVRKDGHIRTTRPWLNLVQKSQVQEDIGFNLEALG
jgi:hypothetical protein